MTNYFDDQGLLYKWQPNEYTQYTLSAFEKMTAEDKNQTDICMLLERARDYAIDYVSGIDRWFVYPEESTIEALSSFDEPLPVEPTDGFEMLKQLHHIGSPGTVAQTGGRYFGFVNGATHPPALAAK